MRTLNVQLHKAVSTVWVLIITYNCHIEPPACRMILKLAFPKSKLLQGQTKQVNVITGLGDSVAHKQEGLSLKPISRIEQTKSPFTPALSLSFQSCQAQNNYEQHEPLGVMIVSQ